MARAALGWGVRDLAEAARISFTTVNRFERGLAEPHTVTLDAIQRALEAAGIEFLPGGGVRPREQPAEASTP
jgi:transcriptional regulator with XRE-family HTH domain